ncbi:hypothetical protein [Amycolatopsis sp. NPDC004079]|uniref:hypothetical protein n=1 Tax=Amycolatopsis sp. NPDC004079 TaxID=3154549 RepID=UPI0033BB4D69
MAKHLVTFGCGAGTQSTALYFLMRDGAVPKPDAAIFADTGDEPAEVYETVRFLADGFREIGVPFHVVGRDEHVSLMRDVLDRQVYATLPAFTAIETTMAVPLWWDRCACEWGKVFGVGGERGVKALRQFAPGVTAGEIARHADTHVGGGDCDLCTGDRDDDPAAPGDEIARLMLRETGLAAVPAPHLACRAEGRIVTRSHTYTKIDRGRIKRECTGRYKIEPIERQIRILLGARQWGEHCRFCDGTGERVAPWDAAAGVGPCSVCRGTGTRHRVGSAPKGSTVRHIIGFSADEILDRATTAGFARTTTPIYPLADLGMTRKDCEDLIRRNGRQPVRSACIQCPLHGNRYWRHLRDRSPREWQRAVAFDRAFRTMPGLKGKRYLHASRLPLDVAPIDKPTADEMASAQGDLLRSLEEGSPAGCSPYSCRSGEAGTGSVHLGSPC